MTQSIQILLVEDNPLILEGVKAILGRKSDCVVVAEAQSGEKALAEFSAVKPDLVVMDLGLPGMDGIETIKQIIERSATAKIMVLTDDSSDSRVLSALLAGASGYCLKSSVDEDRLHRAVQSVSAGNVWLDGRIGAQLLTLQKRAVVSKPADQAETAHGLTVRELEVLRLISAGHSNQEIASALCVSIATAKTHVRSVLKKLNVQDRTQAAVFALGHSMPGMAKAPRGAAKPTRSHVHPAQREIQ